MSGAEGTPRRPVRRRPGIPTVTRVEVETDRGVFMISVAAELANMHPQTLRMYEARGLIEPQRSPKGTRLYSQEDVERLRRIQEMTADLGPQPRGRRARARPRARDRRDARAHRADRNRGAAGAGAARRAAGGGAPLVPRRARRPTRRGPSSSCAPPTRAPPSQRSHASNVPEATMQPDRFTIKSQEALASSARLAQESRNPQVTPVHLLAVLLGDGASDRGGRAGRPRARGARAARRERQSAHRPGRPRGSASCPSSARGCPARAPSPRSSSPRC